MGVFMFFDETMFWWDALKIFLFVYFLNNCIWEIAKVFFYSNASLGAGELIGCYPVS